MIRFEKHLPSSQLNDRTSPRRTFLTVQKMAELIDASLMFYLKNTCLDSLLLGQNLHKIIFKVHFGSETNR